MFGCFYNTPRTVLSLKLTPTETTLFSAHTKCIKQQYQCTVSLQNSDLLVNGTNNSNSATIAAICRPGCVGSASCTIHFRLLHRPPPKHQFSAILRGDSKVRCFSNRSVASYTKEEAICKHRANVHYHPPARLRRTQPLAGRFTEEEINPLLLWFVWPGQLIAELF